jgi:hypothetical protein
MGRQQNLYGRVVSYKGEGLRYDGRIKISRIKCIIGKKTVRKKECTCKINVMQYDSL